MPRSRKSDGNLFNISNLEEAKRLVADISDILNAPHPGAAKWEEQNEKMLKMSERLMQLSNQQYKQDEIGIESRNKAFRQQIKWLQDCINLQEQQIKNKAAEQIAVEKEVESQKQVEKIKSNQQKLKEKEVELNKQANKVLEEQLKLIEKQAEKEYDSMTFTQKMLVKRQDFVGKAKTAYGKAFKTNIESEYQEAFESGGNFSNKDISRIGKESLNGVNLNAKQFVEGSKRLNVASNILQVAGEGLKKSISIITETFKKGINEQSDIYEKTFQDISTRTGIDNPTYFSNQHSTMTTLMAQGLNDNIKVSEVQSMWESLAKNGMNEQDMFANALDNVITKNIVPYLDTTSQDINLLNNRLDGNFIKQIRGINQANLDIAGNNYATEKVLNQLLDAVQPMSDEALQNLAQGSEELTAYANYLMSPEGGNLSYDQANAYIQQLYKQQNYSGQMLRNGSVYEKVSVLNTIGNNRNLEDPRQFNNIIGDYVDASTMLGSIGPGYGNALDSSIMSLAGESLGIDRSMWLAQDKIRKSGNTGSGIAAKTEFTSDMVNKYSSGAFSRFNAGTNQTSKTRQETTLENLSTDVAIAKEYMGKVYDVLESILGAVWKLASAWLGGKILGSVGGKLFGSTAGKTLGTGLGTKALNAVGSGLMDVGFSAGYTGNSVAGAIGTGAATTLGAAALVGGGTALGVNGAIDAVNDFKSGDTARGVMSTGQAAAGLGAAGVAVGSGIAAATGGAGLAGGIAAAATNPVGWALLAAAGGIALGKHLYDLANLSGDISEELKKETDKTVQSFRDENNERIDNLNELRDQVKNESDIEKQKQMLINAGIATEKDLQDSRYDQKDALIALTDQYIASTKELNHSEEALLSDLESKEDEKQSQISKDMYEFIHNAKFNDMNDDEKSAFADFGKKYAKFIEDKAASGDKDAQYRLEKWEKAGVNLYDDILSEADVKAIAHTGGDKETNKLIKAFMSDSTNVHKVTASTAVQKQLGLDGAFNRVDYSTAIRYVRQAIDAGSEDSAKNLLSQAKDIGLTYDLLDDESKNRLKEKWNITSYRQGTDSIPYDGYPALLHQGEAVLTASTANEMRNLVDEYRDGKDTSANFDVIIESQTVAIVEKMDEIIAIMNNMSSSLAQPTTNSNSSAKASQLSNMVRMRNSKSWA